jgi:hypothetical protein
MSLLRNAVIVVLAFLIFFPAPIIAATVQVSWNANTETDLAGYLIYYGTQSGNYTACYDVGNVTSYQLTEVQNGTTCYIAVAAYDTSQNDSELSDEKQVTIPALTQQTAITLLSPVNGSVVTYGTTLKWSGTGFRSYSVRVSKDYGVSWSTIYTGTSTSCTINSLLYSISSGKKVYWYVRGTTTSGQYMKSSIRYFTKK